MENKFPIWKQDCIKKLHWLKINMLTEKENNYAFLF